MTGILTRREATISSLVNCCKATVLSKWIRWTLVKKITSWHFGCLTRNMSFSTLLLYSGTHRFMSDLWRGCRSQFTPCSEMKILLGLAIGLPLLSLCLGSHCASCIQGSFQVIGNLFFQSKWQVTVEEFQCLKAKKWSTFKIKIKMHIGFILQ